MLMIDDLALMIQEGLNNNQMGEAFVIGTNIADFRKLFDRPLNSEKPTRGVVRFLSGDAVPVRNLQNVDTVVLLELLVEQSRMKAVYQVLTNYATMNFGGTEASGGMQIAVNFSIPVVGRATNGIVGSGIPVQLMATFKFIQNGFYGNQVQVFAVDEEGAETELMMLDKSFGMSLTQSAYQNLGEATGHTVNTQNIGDFRAVIPLLEAPFYEELVNDILHRSYQNKIYRFRFLLVSEASNRTIFDMTENYVLTMGSIPMAPDGSLVLTCSFSPAHEIVEV